jgi:Uma2 family endonuclease
MVDMVLEYFDEPLHELINGKVVKMVPAPGANHADAMSGMGTILRSHLRGTQCRIYENINVYLGEGEHYIPDISVVCDISKIRHDGIHGAPDLVVEVLSKSTARYDRGHKKDVYGKCGVTEYWLVDIKNRAVEVYCLDEAILRLNNIYSIYEDYEVKRMSEAEKKEKLVYKFNSKVFPDIVIDIEEIFSNLLFD